jgi:hypothetical protein
MVRTTFLSASLFLMVGLASAQEPAKQPDRAATIEKLRTEYQDVVDRLNKNDPGEATRTKQKAIVDLLDKLLQNDNPPPCNCPPQGNPPPKPPMPQADPMNKPEADPGAQDQPKPQVQPNLPMPKPQEDPGAQNQPKPQVQPDQPKPQVQPAPESTERVGDPKSIEEMQKQRPNNGGYWPDMPPRHRAGIETHLRDRFPPRYEELLRAYYRNLAESGRKSE